MIAIVTCTCGGAEGLARTVLKNGGHPDWLNVPIASGAKQTEYVLDTLKDKYGSAPGYAALRDFVKNHGRYVVVIGFNGKVFAWTDISRGTLKDRLDAEILVNEFAQKSET